MMFKMKNEKIEFIESNGKKHIFTNRLQDNFLDYAIYAILPQSIGNTLFPKFNVTLGNKFTIMEKGYIKFNSTQTIIDTDTTMNFDSDSLLIVQGTEPDGIVEEIIGLTGKTLTFQYFYDFSGFLTDPIKGLGFGRDDTVYADYLMSFVDVSALGISAPAFTIIRYDKIETNEKLLTNTAAYHLPGLNGGELSKITTCSDNGGINVIKEYLLADLSFAVTGIGEVEVSGFDTVNISPGLYPSTTTFPGALVFPDPGTLKSMKFTYTTTSGIVETYIELKDLDVNYQGDILKIKLKCERGE